MPDSAHHTDKRSMLFRLGLAALIAVLLWHIVEFIGYARAVLFYPYQIDFGEGIVWQQMRDMLAGSAYAPLRVYPAVVYHYPPVYHLTSAAVSAALGIDQLVAGRFVSLFSTIATAIFAGLMTMRIVPDDWRIGMVGAIIAGLLFLNCYPVIVWGPLMRVDMLTGALGLAGMLVALQAISRPRLIHVAALLFTLSIFTKQISFAAPIATFAILLLVVPKTALRGIASGLTMAFGALALLLWLTDGRFLTHILFYNVNRLAPDILVDVMLPQLRQYAALILIATIGAFTSWRSIRRKGLRTEPAAAMLLFFVGLKTVMLLGMLKSGSSFNYMIEWFSGIAILAAIGLRPAFQLASGRPLGPLGTVSAAIMLGALTMQLATTQMDLPTVEQAHRAAATHAALVRRIAASPRPVISDDMAMIIRAGKKVQFESAITAELGAAGLYDQPGFVRLIRARCFGFFVTDGNAGTPMFDRRYNPPVAAAMAAYYPKLEHSGKFVIHLPVETTSTCPY